MIGSDEADFGAGRMRRGASNRACALECIVSREELGLRD